MLLVSTGVPSPLNAQLVDGVTDKYLRTFISTSAGVELGTVDLTHEARGNYTGFYTFPSDGYFYATHKVYIDSGRTVEDSVYNIKTDVYRSGPIDTTGGGGGGGGAYNLDMTTAIDHCTDIMEFLVWMDYTEDTIEAPLSADLSVFDGAGNLIFTFPTNTTPSPQGVFRFIKPTASNYILRDKTYVTSIVITVGAKTLQKLKSFTVF